MKRNNFNVISHTSVTAIMEQQCVQQISVLKKLMKLLWKYFKPHVPRHNPIWIFCRIKCNAYLHEIYQVQDSSYVSDVQHRPYWIRIYVIFVSTLQLVLVLSRSFHSAMLQTCICLNFVWTCGTELTASLLI